MSRGIVVLGKDMVAGLMIVWSLSCSLFGMREHLVSDHFSRQKSERPAGRTRLILQAHPTGPGLN
jgi:hypothetical protein